MAQRLNEERINKIKRAFLGYERNQKLTTKMVAKELRLDHTTIQKHFTKLFGTRYKSLINLKKRKLTDHQIRSAFEKYKKSKIGIEKIAKKLKVNDDTIRNYFIMHFGSEYKKIARTKIRGRDKKIIPQDELEKAFEIYKNNPKSTLRDIVKELKCSKEFLSRLFKQRFGSEFLTLARKKCGWMRKLDEDDIRKAFQEYKIGVSMVELAKKLGVVRDSLTHRMAKIIGKEYKELAKKRGIEDGAKSRQKVSDQQIYDLFEIYKKNSICLSKLAKQVGLKESSFISRFKKSFGDEYYKIARKRRDERKVSKQQYIRAFERYKNTNISLAQLSDELGIKISSLAPRFRRLFGKQYSKVAQKKSDLIEINKRGKVAENLALEYLRLTGMPVEDVRRKRCILKGSLKCPDFIIGSSFVEVKNYYITFSGFGNLKGYKEILRDYLGKEVIGGYKFKTGIIISLGGFSPKIRKQAIIDKIILIGPEEIIKTFKINGRKDLVQLLNNLKGK